MSGTGAPDSDPRALAAAGAGSLRVAVVAASWHEQVMRGLLDAYYNTDNAQALAHDAREQDFLDISRDAESLRQQLLAALNRAHLLQQKLHPANA